MVFNKKLPVYCWYSSLFFKKKIEKKETYFFSFVYFWLPALTWSNNNKKKYYKKKPNLNKTLYSLFLLFKFTFNKKIKISYNFLPYKRFHSTVTRGPMVRKKQSREQVGAVQLKSNLYLHLFNFFKCVVFKSTSLLFFFTKFLWQSGCKYSMFLDFLLLQQYSVNYSFYLTSFFIFN